MFRAIVFLFLVAVVSISCSTAKSTFNPARKFAPEQLKEDLSLLKTTLEANHPSLYWYTTKDSLDGYYAATFDSMRDSLTEQQFRNKIAWWVSKIHC